MSGENDRPVEQEEDEEGGCRGQDHRDLRILVVVGRPVEPGHWNDAQLEWKQQQ